MDSGTLKITKKLIMDECANFLRTGPFQNSNFCWSMEKKNKGKCLYFSEKVKDCAYFQNCVQPILTIRNKSGARKISRKA